MLNALYKVYFWLIAVPIFALCTIITATVVIVGCLLGCENFFSYYPGMLWSRLACVLTLCPVKIIGRENMQKGKSYVFVSNHQSAYDIFVIYGYIGVPIKWMMKKELSKIPLVGYACRMAGFVFVDNHTAQSAQHSICDAKLKLKKNSSLFVFPEGSRTHNGKMGRFKRGAYQIAREQHLPIVPITLNGPYNVMPTGSWDIKPHKMEIVIHPPVVFDKSEEDDREKQQKIVDATRQTIYNALWKEFK